MAKAREERFYQLHDLNRALQETRYAIEMAGNIHPDDKPAATWMLLFGYQEAVKQVVSKGQGSEERLPLPSEDKP